MTESLLSISNILLFGRRVEDLAVVAPSADAGGEARGRGGRRKQGRSSTIEQQMDGAIFARIYGFSFDRTYYDLPQPCLFLVHGEGQPATGSSRGGAGATEGGAARGAGRRSEAAAAAAHFESPDDLRVWSYDKADFTIRMDVQTGTFEQVLLDALFDEEGGVSGAKVSGAKVSGAKVSGAKVSGAKVAGTKLIGARGSDPRGDATD